MDSKFSLVSAEATIPLETHHASAIDQKYRKGQSTSDNISGN